ncbi:hypothetical protein [Lacinutrix algicola]|uniref:hypothetical protein n=1 Tax=Lacinutrix algicola TaxID=342954 RepID=UPI0006E21273|nr:hypothetical protein [Lacinutrix algicola]
MTETISNTKKSLNVLNKLIQNGHYNGFIESGKFELTRNNFPNNYKLIGTLNDNGKFELKSTLKIVMLTSGKILAIIGIILSMTSFILMNKYWVVFTIILVFTIAVYLGTRFKGQKEIKLLTSKFLELYKSEI